MMHWDLPDGDDRPTRICIWAIVSVVCGLFILTISLLVVAINPWNQSINHGFRWLFTDLLTLSAFLSGGFGVTAHFIARRQIARSASMGPVKIEGDLTALTGFIACLIGWLILQSASQFFVRWVEEVVATLVFPSSELHEALVTVHFAILGGLLILGTLYVFASGPPAAKSLIPVLLLLIPILLVANGILKSREAARQNEMQNQLRRAGQGFYFHRELLRRPAFRQ